MSTISIFADSYILKSDFRIMILDIRIASHNEFKMGLDKIQENAFPYTPVRRKLYLITDSKIGLFLLFVHCLLKKQHKT